VKQPYMSIGGLRLTKQLWIDIQSIQGCDAFDVLFVFINMDRKSRNRPLWTKEHFTEILNKRK